MQLSFLNMPPSGSTSEATSIVNGLFYIANFLSEEQHAHLLSLVDNEYSSHWLDDLTRRVQHYGYRYEYKSRRADPSTYLGPLPPFLAHIGDRLIQEKWFPEPPNQAIINEYIPGQGISAHVDCVPCFGPVVASISLGSACIMDFKHKRDKIQTQILLEPRSLLILSKDARYLWTHEIAGRRSDKVDGQVRQRGRRVSITFRRVVTISEGIKSLKQPNGRVGQRRMD